MTSNLLYIGHRGSLEKFEENTLIAFENALECGADYIEFDVRRTKDEKLVIIHDSNLERTTNGKGYIHLMDYNEILEFETKIGHFKIPLLIDVLEQFQGKIKFMLDLKTKGIWKDVIKYLLEKGLLKDCILSSRILEELIDFKFRYPEGLGCYNITKAIGFTYNKLLNSKKIPEKIDMISLSSEKVNSKFIRICHDNNILALSWNFRQYSNPLRKIKKIIKKGIDGILFDNCCIIPVIKKWTKRSKC
ncbi:MAG: glycerophosphodiester phosphodiesterase family protein [Candidatus Lokiarchaeota archaeon]|nr:glycerophosphodiester phosphodiesterase family protein [Candidatus Lokiarchaeota archaeon]